MSVLRQVARRAKRQSKIWYNQIFRRVDKAKFKNAFRQLGLKENDLVIVHTSLSRFGYVEGGAPAVIEAFLETVGPGGTVAMPTFSFDRRMQEYVAADPLFDVATTPSMMGRITEDFRLLAGAKRSLHPTHSVAAIGPLADKLLEGHENSSTPFGPGTPYSKLPELNGKVILMGVNANSFLHLVEEEIDIPHLYLPVSYELRCADADGREFRVKTKVHEGNLSHYIVVDGKDSGDLCLVWVPTYGLPDFIPGKMKELKMKAGPRIIAHFEERMARYKESGAVRYVKVAGTPLCLIDVNKYWPDIAESFRFGMSLYPDYYDLDKKRAIKNRVFM